MPDRPPGPYPAVAGLCFWTAVASGILSIANLEISPWWPVLALVSVFFLYCAGSLFVGKLERAAGAAFLKRTDAELLTAALEDGKTGKIPHRKMTAEEVAEMKTWAGTDDLKLKVWLAAEERLKDDEAVEAEPS